MGFGDNEIEELSFGWMLDAEEGNNYGNHKIY